MSPRYLLLVGNPQTQADLQAVATKIGLATAFSGAGITLLVNRSCIHLNVGLSGCVIGTLFRPEGRPRRLRSLAERESVSVRRTCGKALLSSFFGGYVAAIQQDAGVTICRDPSGALPCFFAKAGDQLLFASDAALLAATGLVEMTIDHAAIGRQLYRAGVPAPTTALDPVRELMPGFALDSWHGTGEQRLWWSPWEHVAQQRCSTRQTTERLREVVCQSVHAWASLHDRWLLSVSGGLDSSIVAASLARSRAETVCLTMFTDDAGGDERSYARALCNHLALPLVERPYRLGDIDLGIALGAQLPRPRDRTQAIAYERTHLEVAEEVGATAFMTGNGGDSVFGYSQSAAPLADRFLSEGLGRNCLVALLDVCRHTGCSISEAAVSAWRLARGSPNHVTRPNALFLSSDFVLALGEDEPGHPWLDAPRGSLPGKAAHIGWILRIQHCLEVSRGGRLPVINPLMSQPILETCLAIPSWEWRAGGQDRAAARLAFARDLPTEVVNRRIKGSPSYFAARLLDHFRSGIRERLLGGQLARARIIDTRAIERALASERQVPDLERVRLLELVNVEAWLEHWTRALKPSEAAEAIISAARPRDRPQP